MISTPRLYVCGGLRVQQQLRERKTRERGRTWTCTSSRGHGLGIAVSLSRGCGVFGRHGHRDTQQMQNLRGQERDAPAARAGGAGSVNSPESSRVVKGRKNTLDDGKRSTGRLYSNLVKASTPILYCSHSRQEEKRNQSCSIEYRYGITLDALTKPPLRRRRAGVSLVKGRISTLDGVDEHSGEVTL